MKKTIKGSIDINAPKEKIGDVLVEVFKTNVTDRDHATMILDQIHKTFHDYTANFDLDDCDRILRVKCTTEPIQSYHIIGILRSFGCKAEVLPDDDQPFCEMALIDHRDYLLYEDKV